MPWPKGKPSWNKGLTKDSDTRLKQHADKVSKTTKGRKSPLSEDSRKSISEKMSVIMKERYASGWESTAGRCKKYTYNSPIAGTISVDGSWELEFCKFMDTKGLMWNRNKQRFPYTRPNGKQSTYQPDFYIKEWNAYVEVKGYETDLDKAKWSQFPHKLIILRRNEIGDMDEWFKSAPC